MLNDKKQSKMKPTPEVLKKAIAQVSSPFTKEIIKFGFSPNSEKQFGISVINVRGGEQILIDYYFTIKTGKLIKSLIIERKHIS